MDCIIDNLTLSGFSSRYLEAEPIKRRFLNNKYGRDAILSTYNFLTSIILYDHILYDDYYKPDPTRGHSRNSEWSYKSFRDYIIRNTENKIVPFRIPEQIQDELKIITEEQYKKIKKDEYDRIIYGAIKYVILSQMLGLNYIPAPSRNDFLNKESIKKHIDTPGLILGKMEKELQLFIDSVYREIGINSFKFNMPLLAQFLIYNTKKDQDVIKAAIKLSKAREIVVFKSWLNDLQNAINSSNVFEVKKSLSLVDESLELVRKEFQTKKSKVNVAISLSPSINVDINLPNLFNRNNVILTLMKKMYITALKNPKPQIDS